MEKYLFVFLLVAISTPSLGQTRDLDYYLKQGIENSPLLMDYANQIKSAQIDSQRMRAVYKPQVTAASGAYYAPVVNGYGYDAALTNSGSYAALVTVDQAIVSKGNLNTQIAATRLQRDSIANTRKISEQDLRRTIISQYVTTYGDLLQLNFNEKVIDLLAKEEGILKKLTETNVYKQAEYLTFLVTRQQQALQLKQLRIQFRTNLSTLNYLCGIYDTTYTALAEPVIATTVTPDISNSIFYRQYILDSMRGLNNIALLKYSYRPRLNAFINGGYNSSFLFEAYKNFGTSAGLNFSLPIYDGRQKHLQYEKIMLTEASRISYRDFFTRQYNQQVALLQQQLNATEALIDDINNQVKYAETLINVNGRLMETGDTRIADYVIAINSYLAAKNLLTQNSISRLQIMNQLNYWNK